MTESERVEDAPLMTFLPKTLGQFKVMSATSENVTVDENGTHNIVSVDRVTLYPYNTRSDDGTDRECDTRNANSRRNEDQTDANDASIIGELSIQCIIKHIGSSNRMQNAVRWYSNGPKTGTEEPLQHVLQHFSAIYWRRLNRLKE